MQARQLLFNIIDFPAIGDLFSDADYTLFERFVINDLSNVKTV